MNLLQEAEKILRLENTDHLINLGSGYFLLKKSKNRFIPYKQSSSGQINPIRGRNKNGALVWRTYKSEEEARREIFQE